MIKLETRRIPASEMTRSKWVVFKWVNTQEIGEPEPMYLCCWVRDISEAKESAEQFDAWIKESSAVEQGM